MIINILKSKLHRATITDVHLDYEGSCAIDANILQASGINEYEMIHIYNLNNGNRFTPMQSKLKKKFRGNNFKRSRRLSKEKKMIW